MINDRQTVKDIIAEVLEAHQEFSPYYDKIALYFDDSNSEKICDKIYRFLKENVKYKEESENDQTSALPTGILIRGHGDCKHFSGFSAGILDALNRTGKKLNWCYRFASYRVLSRTPHHVFVVVKDQGSELWIDPTPGADKLEPVWIIDKKINAKMPLRRNIAGVQTDQVTLVTSMGVASLVLTPFTGDNLNFDGTGKYANAFVPFLGLSSYQDYGGVRSLNKNQVADQINAAIATGPAPGHSVTGDFVQWVYDNSIRSWNFLYPGGVDPNFNADPLLPANYPRWKVDDENKSMSLDRPGALDDYRNGEIHLMTAWAQKLINESDPVPYPVTPKEVKEFSQGINGDDMFVEPRGKGFFTNVFDFVKKFGLAPERNAYLGLVGLNFFGMASKLHDALYNDDGTIDPDAENKIKSRWDKWGGDWNKFLNTIEHGSKKKAILGAALGVAAAALPVWVAIAAALIAAIEPMVKTILAAKSNRTGLTYGTNPLTGLPYPAVPITSTYTSTGLSTTGLLNTLKSNPLPVIGIGAGVYLLMISKKSKVTGIGDIDTVLPYLLIAGGAYFLFFSKPATMPTATQITQLNAWADSSTDTPQQSKDQLKAAFLKMSPTEIGDVYNYIFNYVIKNTRPPAGDPLFAAIALISTKYQIFT
jgi:hypothetical protein